VKRERISEPVIQEPRARNNQQHSQVNYDNDFQNKESLTSAVHSISSRLERFENKLHNKPDNSKLNSSGVSSLGQFTNNIDNNLTGSDLGKIIEQIAQLTHVVELLSGAVGESGQVKRLEAQIDNIANLINESYNSSSDYSDISNNMIALANNVEQLGELQTQASQSQKKLAQELTNSSAKDFGEDFENISRRIDILAQNINQLSELQTQSLDANDSKAIEENLKRYNETYENGLNSISLSIGNIFERLDQMEHSPSLTQNDIERLFQEIGAVSSETAIISQKIDAGQTKNDDSDLINRVDMLNDRLAQIENTDLNIGDVSTDFINLREMIKDTIEPRFFSLQTRIEELGQYIANNSNADADGNNIPQHNQTSQSGLEGEKNIADAHVAATHIKVEHNENPRQIVSKSDELDEKLLQLKKSFEKGKVGSQETIGGELQEPKLQELEQIADEQPPHVFLDEVEQGFDEVQAEPHRKEVNVNAALEELAERHNNERARKFSMRPSDISQDEGQVQAKLQDTHQPSKITLQVKSVNNSVSDAGYSVDKKKSEANENNNFNPADVERPAMPLSDFAPNAQAAFDNISVEKSQNNLVSESGFIDEPNRLESEAKAQSSRNTFIEAARRAANRQNMEQTAIESQSLIARAFTRFQNHSTGNNTSQEQNVKSNADEPSKADKKAMKKALKQSQKQAKAQNKLKEETQNLQNKPKNLLGFAGVFNRYKKLGIIFVALIIFIILALNLIIGRTNNQPVTSLLEKSTTVNQPQSDQQTLVEIAPADDSVRETIAPLDSAPVELSPIVNLNPIPKQTESINTDALATGSIARNADGAVVVKQEMPRLIDFSQASQLADDISTGSISNAKISTVDSVQLEMPKIAVGPDELREAAAKGNARAQFEVAAIYGEGKALEQDFESAAIWYERSAAQGFAPAGYRLGGLYENGQGVEKNLELARLWYQRAAEAGNRMAMHNLASLYAGTEMGEQDFSSALEWFERAAKNNLTDSQFNLGMLYARGLGTTQDLETAYVWFSIAARNGDKDAAKAQRDIARSLDSVTVSALQKKVANWQSEKMNISANFAPIGTWSNNFDPGKEIANKQVVEKVQSVLLALGFDVGTPDGMMGPRTAQAIKEFEKETGMQPFGKVNPRLLAVLGSQPV